MSMSIDVPQERLSAFCLRYQVRKLSFFGSVLRADFTDESDIDVLVEFASEAKAGFLTLAAMEIELADILGRTTDIRTPEELSRYFRDNVLATAELQYE